MAGSEMEEPRFELPATRADCWHQHTAAAINAHQTCRSNGIREGELMRSSQPIGAIYPMGC